MKRLLQFLFIVQLTVTLNVGPAPAQAQVGTAREILARLSPKERVGQLFLVTFYGTSAEAGSDIERLITQHRIGGVVVMAANDNITDTVNAPAQTQQLIQQLQEVAAAAIPTATEPVDETAPQYVPLFIAMEHGGDYALTQVRSGLTELPNPLAIGAAWSDIQAQTMGEIAGAELSALGVNLLLGPPLDVLEAPRPRGEGDLGTHVFGGDPFWVGKLGREYIRGIHLGAQGNMAVVARHFPGRGGIDRDPNGLEVPIVRKCADQLQQIDLKPFSMVTGALPGEAGVADALMSGHIRFQCLQGNLYQTTEPMSLDPRAFNDLLQGPFKAWRDGGGLTVSESLGARAIKRRYDPNERRFDAARIARDALFAGNDVLFASDFGWSPRQDQFRNLEATLTSFESLYSSDAQFAKRVDAAAERILQVKLRLYKGRFDAAQVTQTRDLNSVGAGQGKVLDLAQTAATLIYPSLDSLPPQPGRNDRIVFVTDTRAGQQCSTCPLTPILGVQALEDAVLQLYGTSLTNARNLQSFGFEDLAAYLNARANPPPTPEAGTPAPEPLPIDVALQQANWIVLSMQGASANVPNGNLVRAFLSQRADLAATKRIVVFAFGAPYYLDATDQSKLAAFYAVYSPAKPFVEAAARLFFREWLPPGHSPVSVESTGYSITEVTAPTTAQTIQLCYSPMPDATPCSPDTVPVSPTVQLKFGDTLYLRSSVIVDGNGNPVPDGTAIRFRVVASKDGQVVRDAPENTVTQNGIASTSLVMDQVALLQISVVEPAARSGTIQLNVQSGGVIEPSVAFVATNTPTPTLTPIPSETSVPATPTLTPVPPQCLTCPGPGDPPRVGWGDFLVMVVGMAGAFFGGWRLGNGNRRFALRLALLGVLGVLASYNYIALGLPGANFMTALAPNWAPTIVMVAGAALALGSGWVWMQRQMDRGV